MLGAAKQGAERALRLNQRISGPEIYTLRSRGEDVLVALIRQTDGREKEARLGHP